MKVLNLFVYGTLRPGQYNDERMGIKPQRVIRNCHVRGAMFNRHAVRPVFPVVDFDLPGNVWGDILVIDLAEGNNADRVMSTHAMEVGAGYVARDIEVAAHQNGTVELINCIAYHYDTSLRSELGSAIPSGSWLDYVERYEHPSNTNRR